MKLKPEKTVCDFCESSAERTRQTTTKLGLVFCNYECMEAYYGDQIPAEEEFLCVQTNY